MEVEVVAMQHHLDSDHIETSSLSSFQPSCTDTHRKPFLADPQQYNSKRKHQEIDDNFNGFDEHSLQDFLLSSSSIGDSARKQRKTTTSTTFSYVGEVLPNAFNNSQDQEVDQQFHEDLRYCEVKQQQYTNKSADHSIVFISEDFEECNPKDAAIIQTDIPERFQDIFGISFEREVLTEDTLDFVVNWISQHFSQNLVQPLLIRDVIILLVQEKLEIPAIWENEKSFIMHTSIDTLWKILHLLLEYKNDIHQIRMRQDDITIEMYPIKQLSDSITTYLRNADSLKAVNDLQTYFIYAKCCNDIKGRTTAEISSVHLKTINRARELHIQQRIFTVFEESIVLVEFLESSEEDDDIQNELFPRQLLAARSPERSLPTCEDTLLQAVIKSSSDRQLAGETIQDYLCLDYLYNPVLRSRIFKSYFDFAVLSTFPISVTQTASVTNDFTIYSEFFSVKKILRKPLCAICNDEYILIKQAVSKNLIQCTIQLSWENQKGFKDEIYQQMLPGFQQKLQKSSMAMKVYVEQLLRRLLDNFIYPSAQTEAMKTLDEKAQQYMTEVSVKAFKDYIRYVITSEGSISSNRWEGERCDRRGECAFFIRERVKWKDRSRDGESLRKGSVQEHAGVVLQRVAFDARQARRGAQELL